MPVAMSKTIACPCCGSILVSETPNGFGELLLECSECDYMWREPDPDDDFDEDEEPTFEPSARRRTRFRRGDDD